MLVLIAAINVKHSLIPDMLTIPMIWIGLIYHSSYSSDITVHIYGSVIGYMLPYSIYLIGKLLTGRELLGHGVFKLSAMLGAWFGVIGIIEITVMVSFLSSIWIIFSRIFRPARESRSYVNVGPYYLLSTLIIYIFHEELQPLRDLFIRS